MSLSQGHGQPSLAAGPLGESLGPPSPARHRDKSVSTGASGGAASSEGPSPGVDPPRDSMGFLLAGGNDAGRDSRRVTVALVALVSLSFVLLNIGIYQSA